MSWMTTPPADFFCSIAVIGRCCARGLSIAHLFDANPRTPEKWPRLARVYLEACRSRCRAP